MASSVVVAHETVGYARLAIGAFRLRRVTDHAVPPVNRPGSVR
ncbi:hypothetical protein AB0A70_17055 [Streptomyces morookaense]